LSFYWNEQRAKLDINISNIYTTRMKYTNTSNENNELKDVNVKLFLNRFLHP